MLKTKVPRGYSAQMVEVAVGLAAEGGAVAAESVVLICGHS